MKNTKNIKKPMPKKAKRVLSIWISIVMMITMMTLCTVTCFAAEDDPITVVNNLSDFMFGLVRAVGTVRTLEHYFFELLMFGFKICFFIIVIEIFAFKLIGCPVH